MESVEERWKTQPPLALREFLLKKSEGCPSPFGLTEDGLCDFRGICVSESLHSLPIQDVDFSNGRIGTEIRLNGRVRHGQLFATFRHCKFVEFACEGTVGENFVDCDFRRAHLNNSSIYGKFINCDFSNASLIGVGGSNVWFEGCSFENAKLRKATLTNCKFIGCRLVNCSIRSGSLAGSSFEKCEIENFDHNKTVMARVKGLDATNPVESKNSHD